MKEFAEIFENGSNFKLVEKCVQIIRNKSIVIKPTSLVALFELAYKIFEPLGRMVENTAK